MGMKPKVEWRPQQVRDAMNVEHLLRKVIGNEGSESKRDVIWATTSKAMGAGCPSPLELTFHYQVLDMQLQDLMCNLLGFQSYFVPILF